MGAVGALAALLFAPKSGKDLRKDIRKKTDEYYDETEKIIDETDLDRFDKFRVN